MRKQRQPTSSGIWRAVLGLSVSALILAGMALLGIGLSWLLSRLGSVGSILQTGLLIISGLLALLMLFTSVGPREYTLILAFVLTSFSIGLGLSAHFGFDGTVILCSLLGSQILPWSVLLLYAFWQQKRQRGKSLQK